MEACQRWKTSSFHPKASGRSHIMQHISSTCLKMALDRYIPIEISSVRHGWAAGLVFTAGKNKRNYNITDWNGIAPRLIYIWRREGAGDKWMEAVTAGREMREWWVESGRRNQGKSLRSVKVSHFSLHSPALLVCLPFDHFALYPYISPLPISPTVIV